MCRYDLPVCPHPHQSPVVNLIYNPAHLTEWHSCDLPRPWGKLSCGNLTIAHPSFGLPQKCRWCTLALYASVSKFKTKQEQYKHELSELERVVAQDTVMKALDENIAEKEAELEGLRKVAWGKRSRLLLVQRGGQREKVQKGEPKVEVSKID